MNNKVICILLGIAMLLSATACGRQSATTTSNAPSQSLSTSKQPPLQVVLPTVNIQETCLYMFVGESYNLSYTVEDSESTSDQIHWVSSTDCVSVHNGRVTAEKEGYAYVSANGSDKTMICILSTQMPTISINTYGESINSKELYTPCQIGLSTENDEYSFEDASAGIRLRGNSTSGQSKKPYRIQFDSKQNLLGMNGGAECKNWVLLAEAFDDSMIRNSTSLSIAAMLLKEYSSDWRYVSLEINGEYQGVYLLCEQSQINMNRIDIEEAGADSENILSGYLFEVDASAPHDEKFKIYYDEFYITDFLGNEYTRSSSEDGSRSQYIALKNDDYTEEQFAFAKKYLQNILQIIYSATYEETSYVFDENFDLVEDPSISSETAISNVVDIDSLVRMYLLSEVMCNHDDYKKSFYFWVDFSEDGNGKLTFGCPWDFDGAIVAWNTYDYRPTDEYFAAKRNIWYVMIMNHDWFRSKVEACWQTQYQRNNAFRATIEMIAKISEHYADDFRADADLWSRGQDQMTHAMLSQVWLEERIAWLNTQFGVSADER